MPMRITVTRSPTRGENKDETDAENGTPIVCSSEEIPSPTTKKVPDGDDGVAHSDNEKDEVDEEPANTTAEASTSAATAAASESL